MRIGFQIVAVDRWVSNFVLIVIVVVLWLIWQMPLLSGCIVIEAFLFYKHGVECFWQLWLFDRRLGLFLLLDYFPLVLKGWWSLGGALWLRDGFLFSLGKRCRCSLLIVFQVRLGHIDACSLQLFLLILLHFGVHQGLHLVTSLTATLLVEKGLPLPLLLLFAKNFFFASSFLILTEHLGNIGSFSIVLAIVSLFQLLLFVVENHFELCQFLFLAIYSFNSGSLFLLLALKSFAIRQTFSICFLK